MGLEGTPRIMGSGTYKTTKLMNDAEKSIKGKADNELSCSKKSITKNEEDKSVSIDIKGTSVKKLQDLGKDIKKNGLVVKYHFCNHNTLHVTSCHPEELK